MPDYRANRRAATPSATTTTSRTGSNGNSTNTKPPAAEGFSGMSESVAHG